MKLRSQKGLTLIELLVAVALFAMIGAGAAALLSSSLQAQRFGDQRHAFYQEGLLIMERITSGLRRCTVLHVPNAHQPVRDILAFSGVVNDDDDYYFGDPLFPRIDEDPKEKMTDDGAPGIKNVDDDGDTQTDEGDDNDDDEDGLENEDPLDGLDNDGDGNIDEDWGKDSGIAGVDDDGDGTIDEGDVEDTDEDGSKNEDDVSVIVYSFDSGAGTLQAFTPHDDQTVVLSDRVTAFQATYEGPPANPVRVLVALTLVDGEGRSMSFSEYVFPRNTYQRTGKRVR